MVSILNIKTSNEDESEELEMQMILVLDLVKTKFGNLTIPEVQEAFKMYVSREFDIKVFRLLDCVSVGEILSEYTHFRNERLNVYKFKQQKINNSLPEMTESAKEEIVKNGINQVYFDFVETSILPDPSEYIFDFLVEKGILKTGKNPKLLEYYQSKLKEAGDQVERELKKAAITQKDEISSKNARIEYQNFITGSSPKVLIRAKKNILMEFFEKQKELKKSSIF